MTFYLVAWVTWACPGGWLSGYVPNKLRPLLCDEGVVIVVYDRLEYAEAAVDRAGSAAKPRLYRYEGLRREELPVTFKPH